MNFTRNLGGNRVFYLGETLTPFTVVLLAKNGGPFLTPTNQLRGMGHGWYALVLSPSDTDTIGPLAWTFPGGFFLAMPHDEVVALSHGTIDRTALDGALTDLAAGFRPGASLDELLQRPLFNFLMGLQ